MYTYIHTHTYTHTPTQTYTHTLTYLHTLTHTHTQRLIIYLHYMLEFCVIGVRMQQNVAICHNYSYLLHDYMLHRH